MNTTQTDVKDWMEKFGQETPSKPCIPSLEVRKLRAKLILEEALETIAGLGFEVSIDASYGRQPIITMDESISFEDTLEPNLQQIADGISDLNFVSYGTAVACGIDMSEIEAEVLRSNMSKLWTENEIMQKFGSQTMKFSREPNERKNANFHAVETGNDRWIVTDHCGKVIKAPSYSPANIQPLLDKQMI